ncbi:MAG: N-6 DNA methylase [Bacilli bacterium]|nr:N-6 DNA methylase [Bacilli bacterium]MBQ3511803.1 N-6 DNA methylase [Bacilli bacterium]
MSLDKNYIKETLTMLGRKYGMRETFEDFVYCCAYSISNLTNFNENREQEYLSISKKYQKEEFNLFAEMLSALTLELNKDDCEDVLGNIFEELGLHDKGRGQFFTPLHVSKLMAQITFDKENIQKEINEKGYITVADECCGSGRMLFAYLSLLKENNIDINNVYFVGADISNLCCCMTYVNLALRGASAIINQQDTLLLKQYGYYITPGLFLNKNLVNKLIDSGYLELIKKTELQQNKELENLEEEIDIER